MIFQQNKKTSSENKKCRFGKWFFGLVLFPAALYTLWRYDQKHPVGLTHKEGTDLDGAEDDFDEDEMIFAEIPTPSTPVEHTATATVTSATAPTVATSEASAKAAPGIYVGNSATKKFHITQCMAVDKIGENEKVTFPDLDVALSAGYVPCKRCNPTS